MAGSGTRCSSLGTCMFDKRGSVDSVRVFFFRFIVFSEVSSAVSSILSVCIVPFCPVLWIRMLRWVVLLSEHGMPHELQ